MISAFLLIVRRELLAAFRKKSDVLNPLWFFILVIILFPLALGPVPELLQRIASGIIWVAALLSSLLSLERLFRDDFLDGSLEQIILAPYPLGWLVSAKVFAHWLLTGLPIVLISPLLAVLLNLDIQAYVALFYSLLIGTPILSFIGAIGVALTVGLRKGGLLLSLLILPLYLPVLIFATAVTEAASLSMPYAGPLAILGAFLVGSITLSPFAIAAALRISIQ